MNSITRKIEFDSGHRVLRHESKCKHLHGHRYVAEITVGSLGLDDLGRVIDFGVIKERIGGWIDEYWDHNLILHPEDPLLLLSDFIGDAPNSIYIEELGDLMNLVFANKAPYVMPPGQNPTAENMAKVLFQECKLMIDSPLFVERVRLYETPNCWADHNGTK